MRSRGILPLAVRFGILEALDDPHPAFLVHGHGDRVDEVRLAGEQFDLEAVGHLHLGDRLFGLQVRLAGRLAVVEAVLLLRERGTRGEQANEYGAAERHARPQFGGAEDRVIVSGRQRLGHLRSGEMSPGLRNDHTPSARIEPSDARSKESRKLFLNIWLRWNDSVASLDCALRRVVLALAPGSPPARRGEQANSRSLTWAGQGTEVIRPLLRSSPPSRRPAPPGRTGAASRRAGRASSRSGCSPTAPSASRCRAQHGERHPLRHGIRPVPVPVQPRRHAAGRGHLHQRSRVRQPPPRRLAPAVGQRQRIMRDQQLRSRSEAAEQDAQASRCGRPTLPRAFHGIRFGLAELTHTSQIGPTRRANG